MMMNTTQPFAIQLDHINEICNTALAGSERRNVDHQRIETREQNPFSAFEMNRGHQVFESNEKREALP